MKALLAVLVLAAPAVALAQPAQAPLLDRLRDHDGAVAGLKGYVMTRMVEPTYCGGFRIVVNAPKARPAKADAKLSEMLLLEFPRDLDFTSAAVRESSLVKFNAWVERLQKVSRDAIAAYATRKSAPLEVRMEAEARRAQVQMRAASVLARAAIPVDVRTGELAAEKTEAFCNQMKEVATPLFDQARASINACAAAAKEFPSAWWSSYCVPLP